MTADSDKPAGPTDAQIEHAVLSETIDLLPVRLTLGELALRVSGELENASIKDSIWKLKRSGLIRENGEVLEPTFAAFSAAEVFESA